MKMNKLTKRAITERETLSLDTNADYLLAFNHYVESYSKRPPHGTPDRNMIRALRMLTRLNTSDDWARLHACEAFIVR
jgi:hypothetical protein